MSHFDATLKHGQRLHLQWQSAALHVEQSVQYVYTAHTDYVLWSKEGRALTAGPDDRDGEEYLSEAHGGGGDGGGGDGSSKSDSPCFTSRLPPDSSERDQQCISRVISWYIFSGRNLPLALIPSFARGASIMI